jgi:hypothetical protein
VTAVLAVLTVNEEKAEAEGRTDVPGKIVVLINKSKQI